MVFIIYLYFRKPGDEPRCRTQLQQQWKCHDTSRQ